MNKTKIKRCRICGQVYDSISHFSIKHHEQILNEESLRQDLNQSNKLTRKHIDYYLETIRLMIEQDYFPKFNTPENKEKLKLNLIKLIYQLMNNKVEH